MIAWWRYFKKRVAQYLKGTCLWTKYAGEVYTWIGFPRTAYLHCIIGDFPAKNYVYSYCIYMLWPTLNLKRKQLKRWSSCSAVPWVPNTFLMQLLIKDSHTNTRTYTHMHIRTETQRHAHPHTRIHARTYTHMHIRTDMHTHARTYTHLHIHTDTRRYTHADTHTYEHTHTHTDIYAHTDTHKWTRRSRPRAASWPKAGCGRCVYVRVHVYVYACVCSSASTSPMKKEQNSMMTEYTAHTLSLDTLYTH